MYVLLNRCLFVCVLVDAGHLVLAIKIWLSHVWFGPYGFGTYGFGS